MARTQKRRGPGRPEKDESEKRTTKIEIRLTEREKERIRQAADDRSMPMSRYCRKNALAHTRGGRGDTALPHVIYWMGNRSEHLMKVADEVEEASTAEARTKVAKRIRAEAKRIADRVFNYVSGIN